MTIKFLKQWGMDEMNAENREYLQRCLDGGVKAHRALPEVVAVDRFRFFLKTPGEAVKFAAALNKLRRPLRLIKKDLDDDWAQRVKERDGQTCAMCGVKGSKTKPSGTGQDALTAHHWYKTKSRAGMARWARACGVTVHFSGHIHSLHENPCWMDLEPIYGHVENLEGLDTINALPTLVALEPTEERVRALWLQRIGNKVN